MFTEQIYLKAVKLYKVQYIVIWLEEMFRSPFPYSLIRASYSLETEILLIPVS